MANSRIANGWPKYRKVSTERITDTAPLIKSSARPPPDSSAAIAMNSCAQPKTSKDKPNSTVATRTVLPGHTSISTPRMIASTPDPSNTLHLCGRSFEGSTTGASGCPTAEVTRTSLDRVIEFQTAVFSADASAACTRQDENRTPRSSPQDGRLRC